MLKAKELQAPVERLLHALHRRDASLIGEMAAAFSKEAQRCRVIQAKKGSKRAGADYEFGAWEVLEALAVRANARQKQNARVGVAKRRYALDMLQILARSPTDAMSPGALTRELSKQHVSGIHVNNVSRLIARLKDANLVNAHEGSSSDARTKPVQLTESGFDVLERLRPGWRTPSKPPHIENRLIDDNGLYYLHARSLHPIEGVRKPYGIVTVDQPIMAVKEPVAMAVARVVTVGQSQGGFRTRILQVKKSPRVKYAEPAGLAKGLKRRKSAARMWGGPPINLLDKS